MRVQDISLIMSSFSSEIFEKTIIAYKKQKEEDRRKAYHWQCPHSPQKLKTIAYKKHSFLLPSLCLIFYSPYYFYYFNFLFNSGSVFTKQELLINTSSSSL